MSRDGRKSQAEIAAEYMHAHAQQVREGQPQPQAPEPRFPSDLDTRRGILAAIAAVNSKYAKPFDKGKMAGFSLVGTESWSEYGAVVLQMAMLDTLLQIEDKLSELLETLKDSG